VLSSSTSRGSPFNSQQSDTNGAAFDLHFSHVVETLVRAFAYLESQRQSLTGDVFSVARRRRFDLLDSVDLKLDSVRNVEARVAPQSLYSTHELARDTFSAKLIIQLAIESGQVSLTPADHEPFLRFFDDSDIFRPDHRLVPIDLELDLTPVPQLAKRVNVE